MSNNVVKYLGISNYFTYDTYVVKLPIIQYAGRTVIIGTIFS